MNTHTARPAVRLLLSVAGALLCALAAVLLSSAAAHAQGGGTIYLPIARGGSGPATPAQPSRDLIAAAEKAGTITHEQALAYAVYAFFNDPRLPAQFRGAQSEDTLALALARAEWGTLSAATQAALAPYFLPPVAPGSWYAQQAAAGAGADAIEWRTVPTASGVKVWYQTRFPADAAKAATVAAEVDRIIFKKLSDLMAKPWLADGGLPNNGGGPELDLYLVQGPSITWRGLATPYTNCENTAAWINLNSDRDVGDELHAGIIQTAAHEMMHAVQFAYTYKDACDSYLWLMEATAKWVEHHVYRDAQSEHPYAEPYLRTAYWSLEELANDRHYGAYLYFLFVTERTGRTSSVRRAFENAASMGSLKAVNDGGAGFESYWSDFALQNWNDGPATDYQEWDSFLEQATPHGPPTMVTAGSGTKAYTMDLELQHLSTQYFRYTFADANVRSFLFYNGISMNLSEQPDGFFPEDIYPQGEYLPLEARAGTQVQALFKIVGEDEWQVEDWTLESRRGFCLDKASERLQELVLVVSNAQYDKTKADYTFRPQGMGPLFVANNRGCWQWKGTLAVTNSDWDVFQISANNVLFERNDDWPAAVTLFNVKSGSGTINLRDRQDETDTDLYTDGPQPFSITPGSVQGTTQIMIARALTGGPRIAAVAGSLQSNALVTLHRVYDGDSDIPGREDHLEQQDVGWLLWLPAWDADDVLSFGDDGGVLQGTTTFDSWTFTFNLRAVRE